MEQQFSKCCNAPVEEHEFMNDDHQDELYYLCSSCKETVDCPTTKEPESKQTIDELLLGLANKSYWHGVQAAQHDSLHQGGLSDTYQPLTPAKQAIKSLIEERCAEAVRLARIDGMEKASLIAFNQQSYMVAKSINEEIKELQAQQSGSQEVG